jgi:hypothetical protein
MIPVYVVHAMLQAQKIFGRIPHLQDTAISTFLRKKYPLITLEQEYRNYGMIQTYKIPKIHKSVSLRELIFPNQ